MAFVKTGELRQMYEKMGPRACCQHLRESLQKKHLRPEDFSLRDLAEGLVPDGREWVRSMNPRFGGDGMSLLEAGAVQTAAFKNISGQIAYTAIMEAYQNPMFVWPQLCSTVSTVFDGEKIPGMTHLGDQAQTIDEGQSYPMAGVGEDWVETPQTTKRGLTVAVTKEAIFFDRLNLVLDRCRQVGESLGINKEKRIIDLALGVTNTYKWKGTAYNTYQTTTPWVNVVTSNGLENWTDIDAALQKFAALTDPATGEPILVAPSQLLCHSSKASTAKYILNATQILQDPNNAANTANVQMYYQTPVATNYQIVTSPWIDARYTAGSVTSTYWYLGDFKRAFAYMENWPITVVNDGGGDQEFTNDIVARFKASERGAAAVRDPRYTQQSQA